MTLLMLLTGVLACWRVTHLLHAEDGPGELLVRVRKMMGTGIVGKLFDCFYCLSLWIAAPLAVLLTQTLKDGVLTWLALSGGACLLERATQRRDPDVVRYVEPLDGGE